MAFKHINANEQITDGSIGTSLIADGAITSAKLAFNAITSSNFFVDSNIDFNNFQALDFRIENLNFFPIAGNPGRLIWRTDLQDIFVDSDFTLDILQITNLPLHIGLIADATHMSVSSTTGLSVGDALIQGGFPFSTCTILSTIDTTHLVVASTAGINPSNVLVQAGATSVVTAIIDATHLTVTNTNGFQPGTATVSTPFVTAIIQSITDSTHIVVDSTAGFIGQAVVSADFGIVTVTDGTHLVVDNSSAMTAGDVINQGLASTVITSVVDLTHITVNDTTGFSVGIATVLAPIDVLAIPDSTHLVVSDTSGFGPGDSITQGLASTTITAVPDATHLVVVDTNGFALNAAKDSTITVDSTAHASVGQYLSQHFVNTVVVVVADATHLAVADATGFVLGPAFTGNWVAINEGANVTSIHADNNPLLHGDIQFLSGTNAHLPQLGQTITVNVPAAGTTGQLQFNLDTQNDFGADVNLFWDNINKRLGIGNNAPATTLDVSGTAHVSGATSLSSTLDVTGDTQLHSTVEITGTTTVDTTTLVVDASTHNVGIGTTTPDTSAMIDVKSTTRGALVPRMTTAQRDAIVSPAVGLLIYNLDSNLFNFWTGTTWLPVGSPVGNVGDVQFNAGGGLFGANPNFYWDIANARLGIGNAAPTVALEVTGDVHIVNPTAANDLTFQSDNDSVISFKSANGSTLFANMDFTSSGIEINHLSGGIFLQGGPGAAYTWRFNPDSTMSTPGALYVNQLSGSSTLDVAGTGHFTGDVTVDTKVNVDEIVSRTGNLTLQPLTDSSTAVQIQAAGGARDLLTVDSTNSIFQFWPRNDGYNEIRINGTGTYLGFADALGTTYSTLFVNSPGSNFSLNTIDPAMDIKLIQDRNGNAWAWTFDKLGNLTLPGDDKKIIFGASGNAWMEYTPDNGANQFLLSTDASNNAFVGSAAQLGFSANCNLDGTGTFVPNVILANDGGVGLSVAAAKTFQINGDSGSYSGGTTPSAVVQLVSTTQGFLPPVMTTTQRNAISSPVAGLEIYNSTTNEVEYYNGTIWSPIGNTAVAGANTQVQFNNNGVFGASSNLTWVDTSATSGVLGLGPNGLLESVDGPGGGLQLSASGSGAGVYFATPNSGNNSVFLDNGNEPQLYINAANPAPDPSANLQTDSTKKGFLKSRMTTVQRDAIVSPAVGLEIYNITTNANEVWDGTEWNSFGQHIVLPNVNASIALGGATPLVVPSVDVSTNGAVISPEFLIWKSGSSGTSNTDRAGDLLGESDGTIDLYTLSGKPLRLEFPGVIIDDSNSFTDPDASAILDLKSTTRGLLPPRMTTTQKNAIASPATGLMVYDTTLNNLQEYNGTMWRNVAPLFQQDIFNVSGPGNVFTLTFTPLTNSQHVFYNGLALAPGVTEDYTISGNVVTLNAGIVLTNGDKILVTYSY